MFHIIDSEKDLEILDKELILSSHLAVDTEFYRRGKEEIELCLIQVNNSEETFIIDCILLGEYHNNCKFLFSKDVRKIFHSCREDVEAIHSWTQSRLENVFDTQLANSFLGGSFSIGYQNLVLKKFGVSIDKDETRSNWKKRPLTNLQLKYAATDVEFLINIFNEQNRELIHSNKINWFKDEINLNLSNKFDPNLPVSIYFMREFEKEGALLSAANSELPYMLATCSHFNDPIKKDLHENFRNYAMYIYQIKSNSLGRVKDFFNNPFVEYEYNKKTTKIKTIH